MTSRSIYIDGESSTLKSTFMDRFSTPNTVKVPTLIPIVLEFDGKLTISLKRPFKSIYDFKKVSKSLEDILDDAFRAVQGYLYSKVLQITKKPQSIFECLFKVFVKGPRNQNSLSLKEKLIKYNNTKGFGQFSLESVETNIVKKSSDQKTMKLWIIVVIAGLGGLCLLLAIVLVFQQVYVAFVH